MLNNENDVVLESDLLVGREKYQKERISHWNNVAGSKQSSIFSSHYHRRLNKVYSFIIPQGCRVMEIGCGNGDLLASLKPSYGVGLDFSPKMIDLAKSNHPELVLHCVDICEISSILGNGKFDFIILSDLLNDLWDVQAGLQEISRHCHSSTRIVINFYSRLWQVPLIVAQELGLAKPMLMQNWLTREDVINVFRLSDLETIKIWEEVLFPIPIPVIDQFFNQLLSRIWPFNLLTLANFIIARPAPVKEDKKYSVSVIVPARNEPGNIENMFKRTPEMGTGTELIFVEGNSKDKTYQTIEEMINKYPVRDACLLKQDGIGKGDAVRKGFAKAKGEILMILDADLTVPPEDLPLFYDAIATNKGEFINGVRLVYPMEKEAMRFLNFFFNKIFSLLFSWLLGQFIKDTLCGTKTLWKKDYDLIVANRAYFGDFDLLFGAARLGLKIIDMPIRYRERTYGTTNIQRWKHGWLLMKMVTFAAGRIKFV
jgi:SAM-dependent methyltransferase